MSFLVQNIVLQYNITPSNTWDVRHKGGLSHSLFQYEDPSFSDRIWFPIFKYGISVEYVKITLLYQH